MPKSTFSAADQALCLAVLKQIEVGRIDYELLRVELGLPTKNAAAVRWCRFNAKLRRGAASAPVKTTSQPPSTPTRKPKEKKKLWTKKREFGTNHEEDEVDIKSLGLANVETEGAGGGDDGMREAFQTPIRQLPTRRARVTNFKELAFDGEEEDGEKELDGFEESGVGSAVKEEFDMGGLTDDEV